MRMVSRPTVWRDIYVRDHHVASSDVVVLLPTAAAAAAPPPAAAAADATPAAAPAAAAAAPAAAAAAAAAAADAAAPPPAPAAAAFSPCCNCQPSVPATAVASLCALVVAHLMLPLLSWVQRPAYPVMSFLRFWTRTMITLFDWRARGSGNN